MFFSPVGESYRRIDVSTQLRWDVLVSCRRNNMPFAVGQLAVFQGGPSRTGGKAPISEPIRVERATRKNGQLATAQWVAMKMGRRLRCSSVTSSTSLTSRRANQLATCKRQTGAGCSLLAPCRRPILIATKGMLFRRQDTSQQGNRIERAFGPWGPVLGPFGKKQIRRFFFISFPGHSLDRSVLASSREIPQQISRTFKQPNFPYA
jgi:hypothetical protein